MYFFHSGVARLDEGWLEPALATNKFSKMITFIPGKDTFKTRNRNPGPRTFTGRRWMEHSEGLPLR